MKTKNDALVAVVRVRGRVNVRHDIEETLLRLNLKRVNNCALLPANESYSGMLQKCENYVAYGEIDKSVLEKLVARHAPDLKPDELMSKGYDVKKLKEHMPFRLKPPRRGHRSIKRHFNQGGAVGYMGIQINQLLARMV